VVEVELVMVALAEEAELVDIELHFQEEQKYL
jgi:hypothetical protein